VVEASEKMTDRDNIPHGQTGFVRRTIEQGLPQTRGGGSASGGPEGDRHGGGEEVRRRVNQVYR